MSLRTCWSSVVLRQICLHSVALARFDELIQSSWLVDRLELAGRVHWDCQLLVLVVDQQQLEFGSEVIMLNQS